MVYIYLFKYKCYILKVAHETQEGYDAILSSLLLFMKMSKGNKSHHKLGHRNSILYKNVRCGMKTVSFEALR